MLKTQKQIKNISITKINKQLFRSTINFPLFSPNLLFFVFPFHYFYILQTQRRISMKDNLLFQYIRNAVKEKQNSKPQQTATFAERYCKQQLIKKKLNKRNPHQKMALLMKNFRDLDTYVDLPELIESVKKWKFHEIQQTHPPQPSFIIRQQIHDHTLNQKIKKQLGQKIKEKYLIDNTQANQILHFLQKQTHIRSDGLKNCSYSNLNNLFQQVSQEGDDQTWKANFDFLSALHKANQSDKLFQQQKITAVNNFEEKFKDSQLNSKPRKEFTKLLHKVTTYLQIILETQHKQKWNKKYSHKSQHCFNNGQEQKQEHNQSMQPPANPKLIKKTVLKMEKIKKHNIHDENKENNLQISQKIQLNKLKRSYNFIKHNKELTDVRQSQNSETNKNYSVYSELPKLKNQNKVNSSVPDIKRQKFFRSLHCEKDNQTYEKQRNDSFYKTTSSFKLRTEAILNQFPPENKHKKYNSLLKQTQKDSQSKKCKEAVKQNFTFRNRNIKQKIVNKISGFIREIDEEQHNNRRENNYYTSAINRLQNTLSMCFGQFKQEAVAGDADIETLKRYATFYNHNGPIPILSSCNYGQLLKLNEGGLFAFNTNSTKIQFEPEAPSNRDLKAFQLQVNSEDMSP